MIFDIETSLIKDWLDPKPDEFFCAAALVDGKLMTFTELDKFLEVYDKADTIIGHNIIAFDIPALEHLGASKRAPSTLVLDTLVMSRLDYPDRRRVDGSTKTPHSLEAWGERFGFPKGDFHDFSAYSDEMLEYCVRDVELTKKVYETLAPDIMKQSFIASQLEHRVANMMAKQARAGVYFNRALADKVIDKLERRVEDIDTQLNAEAKTKTINTGSYLSPFKIDGTLSMRVLKWCGVHRIDPSTICGPYESVDFVGVDWGSPVKVKTFLLERGWKPQVFTDKGSPKLENLEDLGTLGSLLTERSLLSHRLGSIKGLVSQVREDNTISAGANPCGTPTGRMRHSRVVNIPKASKYPKDHEKAGSLVWMDDPGFQKPLFGTEMRALFTARPGRILFGYDASALELRILAHYINDPEYTRVICHEDPHVFAQRAADLPTRNDGKTLNYALIYGASDKRLGSLKGGGARDGAAIRKRLYEAIPGLERLDSSVKTAAKKGYLKGLDGRKLYVRADKSPLNTLIQGGGAVSMKAIAVVLQDEVEKTLSNQLFELPAIKVLDSHDEGQWDIIIEMVDAMTRHVHYSFAKVTEMFNLNCPLVGECKTGMNWAETH